MEEENFNQEDFVNFFDVCNEFVDGKFILADIKIAKILRTISQIAPIYDLIAEIMINYDFEKEYSASKVSEEISAFTLPPENHKIIPLVFCLLVEMDSKKINFNEFLKTQFPLSNNQKEEYDAFSRSVIIPFRNSIAEVFSIEIKDLIKEEEEFHSEESNIIDEKIKEHFDSQEEEKKFTEKEAKKCSEEEKTSGVAHFYSNNFGNNGEENEAKSCFCTKLNDRIENIYKEKKEEKEETILLFDCMIRLTGILQNKLAYIRNPLKKSNVSLILEALFEAYKIKNLKIVIALVMSLNSIAGNERGMRNEIRELNAICYDFYE